MNSARQISRSRSIDFLFRQFFEEWDRETERQPSIRASQWSAPVVWLKAKAGADNGNQKLTRAIDIRAWPEESTNRTKKTLRKQTNKQASEACSRDTRKKQTTKGKHQQLICGWIAFFQLSAHCFKCAESFLILTPINRSADEILLKRRNSSLAAATAASFQEWKAGESFSVICIPARP